MSSVRGEKYTILTVWDIHESRKLVGRFPEHPADLNDVFYLFKDKLVVSYSTREGLWAVHVWDLRLDSVREVGEFSNLNLLHVNTDTNVLVTFEINWKANPPEIQQSKWKLMAVELLERRQTLLSLPDHTIRAVNNGKILPRPGFCRHILSDKTIAELFVEIDNRTMHLHLMYDQAVYELSARWAEYPRSDFSRPDVMFGRIILPNPNLVYYWDEGFKMPAVYDVTRGRADWSEEYSLDNRLTTDKSAKRIWFAASPVEQRHGTGIRLFGDKEVIGLAGPGGVEVWFFNPDFAPDSLNLDTSVWTSHT